MSETSASKTRWLWQVVLVLGIGGILAYAASLMLAAASSSNSESQLTYTIKRSNLRVTVVEQGVLESSENSEIKCEVRGKNTVIWVIENGTEVTPGDVLLRLDTLAIEDAINERSKYAHWSRSAAENSKALLARAILAIAEYEDGRYVSQMLTLEKELAIAKSNALTAKNRLQHAKKLAGRGFAFQREIQQHEFALQQAELDVELRKNDITVLRDYEKQIEMETLKGDLAAAKATHDANMERAGLDEKRRDQALEEFKYCVVKAKKSGLVVFPSAAAWKEQPDITEGASVHKNQILLLMPDLSKMQVKVGIHESYIDRMKNGQPARITLPDTSLVGEVSSFATVARPAGWWTGNVVKYDAIVSLPSTPGLKPGMSAEVELEIARHENVLTIPVSAVLETEQEVLCWVMTDNGPQRRSIKLGDSNDVFIVVTEGLSEGDQVVLNPIATVKEAKNEALKTIEKSVRIQEDQAEPESAGLERERTFSGLSQVPSKPNAIAA